MDSARWERIQAVFHEAVECDASERSGVLDAACGEDRELRAEVLAMLEEDGRSASLLDRDLPQIANELMGDATESVPSAEFGPYRIKKKLGVGGMGVVYLAEREDLGNLVAVKVLPHAGLSNARQQHFASEQKLLASLTHPSIARLYDAGVCADGTPWFAMEYVEGLPLDEYCREHGYSIEQRLRLFRSVCQAVQYAHGQAIIHRDLKPSNILVKQDGTPRLLDFGISKRLEDIDEGSNQTQTAWRLMTPAYASPEQVRRQPMGIYSDVYSLGVVLYELLTGRLPFDLSRCSPGATEAIIVEQVPLKPSAAVAHNRPRAGKAVWKDLDVLCLTAMHKDQRQRYSSVEALIRDIDHFLRGEPLEARPDSMAYRLGKFVRRNRRPVLGGALAAVLISGLLAYFTWRLAKARDVALAEAARTQRVEQFLLNLFEGGDKQAGPAENLRVVSLLDQGSRMVPAFSGDPRIQGDVELTLGNIFGKLGKLDRADQLLSAALQRRISTFGSDHVEVAEARVALGLLRIEQARLTDAQRLINDALAVDLRHLPANHPAVLNAQAALGRALEEAGSYDKAVEVLDRVVRIQSGLAPASRELSSSLRLLADAHFYLGHYPTSDSVNRRLLAMDRQLNGEQHPKVAEDWVNLGHIQTQWGHYAEAEQDYRQALGINQAWYGKDHPETANSAQYVAQALYNQSRYKEAEALLPDALAATERAYGPVHPRVALIVGLRGTIALETGRLDQAEADFKRMAQIYESIYGENHMMTATALSTVGRVYVDRKQYARAEQVYRDVLGRYEAAHLAGHMNAGLIHVHLGRTLLLQRRYQDAERESLAGYGILKSQTTSQNYYLQKARTDLAKEDDALGQPDQAARFRAEFAANEQKPEAASKGK